MVRPNTSAESRSARAVGDGNTSVSEKDESLPMCDNEPAPSGSEGIRGEMLVDTGVRGSMVNCCW